MSRQPRTFKLGHSYHITTRCNNREFRLTRLECRQVLLYTLKKMQEKYQFKLYGLCIMSNHVHYLLEPAAPDDIPKIMHGLNWYTAMCFNRMLIPILSNNALNNSVGALQCNAPTDRQMVQALWELV